MIYRNVDEARRLVAEAAKADGIVNVPVIARDIHERFPQQPLFELERIVLGFAELSGVPIVFDDPRGHASGQGLLLEFVTEGDDEIDDVTPVEFQLPIDGAGEPGE